MQPLFQEETEEKVTPAHNQPLTNRTRGKDRVVGDEPKYEQKFDDTNKIKTDSLQTALS